MYIGYMVAMITGFWLLQSTEALSQTYISGLVGSTVRLPCRIDTKTCGTLHSVKWYRGSSRIFVFSDLVKFSKSEGEYEFRANLLYEPNDVMSYLEVKNITNADESIYKCEITYLDVVESCLVVQFINLTTLMAPNYVKVFDDGGKEIIKDSHIGPYDEGTNLNLNCEVDEGKPVPSVQWFKNNELVTDNYIVKPISSTSGRAENKIPIVVSRDDLGATYECRASSQALNKSLSVNFEILVNVKPLRMQLVGIKGDIRQNTTVELQCEVYQALPPANVSWYVDDELMDAKQYNIQTKNFPAANDSTVNTISRLKFIATRNENNRKFKCSAYNPVMTEQDRSKFERKVTVRVLYAPIVTIRPTQVTVNESATVSLECSNEANPPSTSNILWFFNGKLLLPNNSIYDMHGNYFRLKKANRYSLGKYFCSVSNDVGTTNSSEVEVNILYSPTVYVEADSVTTVNESARANVSLVCKVLHGNPKNLTDVQWFFNNKKMFDNGNSSTLVLENVRREHHGNYSCRGQTTAGWGFTSALKEVFVQYAPGPANITYWIMENGTQRDAYLIKKGNTIVLQCNVENLGRPKAVKYNWYEGNRRRENESGITLTLDKVGVIEATNLYSCNAENAAGTGPNASVSIDIHAPPTIINTIKYANPTIADEAINMTCDVECYPLCDVSWKRNDEQINEGYEYQIVNKKNEANLSKNDFPSITSTLVLNLTRFPNGHAVPHRDDATYTCVSTGNDAGNGVSADIYFRVHFPPKDVSVSMQIVDVAEGRLPGKVNCKADARPEATIRWYNESSNVTFSTDATLSFDNPLSRFANTNFTCEASNQYGKSTAWVFFNIKFKPICEINMKTDGSKKILTCSATGNPSAIRFNWTMDESEQKNVRIIEEGNVLEIEGNSETRIYNCTAINEIGASEPCSISVPAYQEKSSQFHVTASDNWWLFMQLSYNWSLAYVIIAVVIILVVLIICVLIIFICRKKRTKEKYHKRIDLPNRQNFDGNNLDGAAPAAVIPKWPLKPGVLVHVNNNHSLNARRLQNTSNNNVNVDGNQTQNQFYEAIEKRPKREQLKYNNDTVPGVFYGKSGVISFRKFDNIVVPTNPRKRKKPGSGPGNLSGKSKDSYNSPSDGLLQPNNDKTFYENLPFHGMQHPPNKLKSDNEARPPSVQSQYDGSSGYGSTRSQLVCSERQENGNSTEYNTTGKFGSYRPKRSKRNWPQFRSLRATVKNKTPMLPIKESSPEIKSNATIDEEGPKVMPKPVPAPRKVIGFSFNKPGTKHTYQNIPIPITPNKISVLQTPAENVTPKQATSHLTNSSPMEYFRLTPSTNPRSYKSNISSNINLKKYKISANNTLSPSLSREGPPTIPRHHNNSAYPSTHQLNNGLVYADLTVSRHKKKYHHRQPPIPNVQTYPYHTEYAVIKFHDVGREIDV